MPRALWCNMKFCVLVALIFIAACSPNELNESQVLLLTSIANSDNNSSIELSDLKVSMIRRVDNGVYFVTDSFFTDESGYFVLLSGNLPEITGGFNKLGNGIYLYEIKG